MTQERYTKLSNGHWIIEATSQVPITLIQQQMRFIDSDNQEHKVQEFRKPEGNPEAPYYYFIEAIVEED